MAPQIAPIWENLFYGTIDKISLKQGYKKIKTFHIGGKVIASQVQNSKILRNGNVQKRITTLYPNSHVGIETKIYTPDGELLKAYAGIRTSSGTKEFHSAKSLPQETLQEMHKSENLKNAKTL